MKKYIYIVSTRHNSFFTKELPRSSCKHKDKPVKKIKSKDKAITVSPNTDFTEKFSIITYKLEKSVLKISYTPSLLENFSK